jgi:hypothetical protein
VQEFGMQFFYCTELKIMQGVSIKVVAPLEDRKKKYAHAINIYCRRMDQFNC